MLSRMLSQLTQQVARVTKSASVLVELAGKFTQLTSSQATGQATQKPSSNSASFGSSGANTTPGLNFFGGGDDIVK